MREKVSFSNGNILISHPETRFPRYMTDSQSNVVWIGSVKRPLILGCVCFLFFLLFFVFWFPFLYVWVIAVFLAAVGVQWCTESQEPAIFKVKSEVSLLHTKTSPVKPRWPISLLKVHHWSGHSQNRAVLLP